MSRTTIARTLALGAALGALSLAFGQGAALAEADAADDLGILKARVEQLSARVAALDALIVRQGAVATIGVGRELDQLHLRTGADPAQGVSLVHKDATLRFARITLIADEVAISAGRKISLKAPIIDLDAPKIYTKSTADVPIKGNAIRENGAGGVQVSGRLLEGN